MLLLKKYFVCLFLTHYTHTALWLMLIGFFFSSSFGLQIAPVWYKLYRVEHWYLQLISGTLSCTFYDASVMKSVCRRGQRRTETHEICGFAAQSAFGFVTNYWNSMIAVTVCTQAYCLASPHKINKILSKAWWHCIQLKFPWIYVPTRRVLKMAYSSMLQ